MKYNYYQTMHGTSHLSQPDVYKRAMERAIKGTKIFGTPLNIKSMKKKTPKKYSSKMMKGKLGKAAEKMMFGSKSSK